MKIASLNLVCAYENFENNPQRLKIVIVIGQFYDSISGTNFYILHTRSSALFTKA